MIMLMIIGIIVPGFKQCVVSFKEMTLIGHISDVVRIWSGSNFVAYKECGRGDGYAV